MSSSRYSNQLYRVYQPLKEGARQTDAVLHWGLSWRGPAAVRGRQLSEEYYVVPVILLTHEQCMLQVTSLRTELDTLKKEHEHIKSELNKVCLPKRPCPLYRVKTMHRLCKTQLCVQTC